MTISPLYAHGDIVYLKVNPENPGMVIGYVLRPEDSLQYLVSFAGEETERTCYAIELTDEKSFDVT